MKSSFAAVNEPPIIVQLNNNQNYELHRSGLSTSCSLSDCRLTLSNPY
jgi:hypothetical protein